MTKKDEEALKEKYFEFQMLEAQMKQLEKQLMAFEQQQLEVSSTINALSELSKVKENTDILVPVASGIFVQAILKSTGSFMMNVGGDVVVEKSPKEASGLLEKQASEIEKAKTHIIEHMTKMQEKAVEIEGELISFVQEQKNV